MSYLTALLEVIRDLYAFVFRGGLVDLYDVEMPGLNAQKITVLVPLPQIPLMLMGSTDSDSLKGHTQLTVENPVQILGTHIVGYVVVGNAEVYQKPMLAFDTMIENLPYATKVIISEHKGRFSKITWGTNQGWTDKDNLTLLQENIFPTFAEGSLYDAGHATTLSVRRFIGDQFCAGKLYLPLQTVEYVMYQLQLSRRFIRWGSERPRPAGKWHTLLKSDRRIHMSTMPRTGACMEYTTAHGQGYIAYTETVRPDKSILITGVGKYGDGQFLKEDIAMSEYINWLPTWIVIE